MAVKLKPKRIVLGSGDVYYKEFTDGSEIPEVDTLCIEDNKLCCIKGGGSITYTPEYYEVTDDGGCHKKSGMTSEEATMQLGVCVFNANTLEVLCETGRVTEDTEKKRRTLKIGGIKNATGKKYVICFHHTDKADGDIWVLIVGKCESGFEISFNPDSETVIDAEFRAFPQDTEGTLVQYIEYDDRIAAS